MSDKITSAISKGHITSDSQGTGIFCDWERNGNIVTVTGTLSHQAQSWSIFWGLPKPRIDTSVDSSGVIVGRLTNGYDVYVNVDGALQIRTNSFTTKYNFAGSYVCQ